MKKHKQKMVNENTAALRALGTELNLAVIQLSPLHIRVQGPGTVVVDYWPSTSKAWLFGGHEGSRYATPKQVCNLAITGVW